MKTLKIWFLRIFVNFGLTLRHFLKTNCIFQCVVFSIGKKTYTFFEFLATWISTDFNGKSIVYFAYFLSLKNVFKNQKVHDLELGDRSGCLYRKTLSCRVLNISCYSKSGLLGGFSKFRRGKVGIDGLGCWTILLFLRSKHFQKFTDFAQIFIFSISAEKLCTFLIKNGHYKPDSITFGCFVPLNQKNSQTLFSNNMTKQYQLEIFGQFVNFCVKLKHIYFRNRNLSLQKAYWTTHSVVVEQFQSSNPWNCWKQYKNCELGNQK